jgi:hypothetical protein
LSKKYYQYDFQFSEDYWKGDECLCIEGNGTVTNGLVHFDELGVWRCNENSEKVEKLGLDISDIEYANKQAFLCDKSAFI